MTRQARLDAAFDLLGWLVAIGSAVGSTVWLRAFVATLRS
jgi:hypothetical protein